MYHNVDKILFYNLWYIYKFIKLEFGRFCFFCILFLFVVERCWMDIMLFNFLYIYSIELAMLAK